jgi:hypothetical protein
VQQTALTLSLITAAAKHGGTALFVPQQQMIATLLLIIIVALNSFVPLSTKRAYYRARFVRLIKPLRNLYPPILLDS